MGFPTARTVVDLPSTEPRLPRSNRFASTLAVLPAADNSPFRSGEIVSLERLFPGHHRRQRTSIIP